VAVIAFYANSLRPEAVALAVGRAGPDDRVVVCGSLYVVADARRLLVHETA